MKTIKIFMIHPWVQNVHKMLSFLKLECLSQKYNFEWHPNSPDYLIVSEHIYTNEKYNRLFKNIIKRKRIVTIFYAGEAITPDFNIFDYAISFDSDLSNADRHTLLPPPFIMFSGFVKETENRICNLTEAKDLLHHKTKFCNFLYSNWNSHPNRDKLFYLISKYKKVDSLGKHLNNMDNKPTGWIGHAQDCVSLKWSYKFSIACENAIFNGYTSEKILTSLEAHTIPIYWGNPKISLDINSKAFINCFEYDSFEQVLDKIKEIDRNDELWCEMILQPWQTLGQQKSSLERMNRYYIFFDNIFSQDLEAAIRTPQGTYPQFYKDFFSKSTVHNRRVHTVAIQKIKKFLKNYSHYRNNK